MKDQKVLTSDKLLPVDTHQNSEGPQLTVDALPPNMFHLGDQNFVIVSCFLGPTRVHIRRYGTNDQGFLYPTKDGVSLCPLVWKELCTHLNTFATFESTIYFL
ncbi:uncharacterized protein LOC118205254 [Stegodyphus dumicola]|uniref:uncharacterized protein LOC118205254 n=1 Tax=Stegodyphus dumicola TaxID=202533 RepID=UPI0015AA3847|nr:uncharacterized protein LOC118205254 [Stegodyphus dumicola]